MIVIDYSDISRLMLRGGYKVVSVHENRKGKDDEKLLIIYKDREGILSTVYTSLSGIHKAPTDIRLKEDMLLDLVRTPYQLSGNVHFKGA